MKNTNHRNLNKTVGSMLILWVALLFMSASGCTKNNGQADFSADCSVTTIDDNHLQFTNTSTGEYYSLVWDFGNGQSDTTTDKKKQYTIYYPVAGTYNVTLTTNNYTGESKTVSKPVTITNNDLQVSFSIEADPENANTYLLKNTSAGNYDSFKWLFRDKVINDQNEVSAYFPYAGTYDVVLEVSKNNAVHSTTQQVLVANDDPNYFNHMVLTWSDEFNESIVDADNWTFETGASGWGNNELQNYTNGDNVSFEDGSLIITAKKVDENQQAGSYTSTRLKSQGKREFQYGRLEIRAQLPTGRGIWPAIWMLGSNFNSTGWPACGEMDIMEYVGYQPNTVFSTVHNNSTAGTGGNGSNITIPTCEEAFHVYGLFWTEKKLVFYVDSVSNVIHTYNPPVKTADNWPFDQPAFFILNVAVGGNWGGAQGIDNTIFPQSMKIDYVRVYQEFN